ncbi:MAG TPA: Fe-S-containing protein [Bacteroidota bacterium]|nr:Fe-S-containing protein [Bacteroidota bacterium]
MIESLIIALREGIEIALVLGIVIVYLRKIERESLVISVYIGLVLAVLASFGGAYLLQKLAIDQESLEGFFMMAAAIFVISMIVWMWITARKIRGEIEEKVGTIAVRSSWKAHAGILSFTFLMIVREGIETAIFLQAVALSTGAWQSALGTIIGLALATVFAVLFIRGSVRIDIGRFLKITAVTLMIFTLQLLLNGVHEFYEYGILPASPSMMGILGPIVQHDVLFIVAILSIPVFMLVFPSRKRMASGTMTSQRRWQLSAVALSVVIISFLGVGEIFSSGTAMDLSSVRIPIPASGLFQIPIGQVGDGNLHRYAIEDNGLEIRFFVIRTGLGTFATAFDACHACYSYGHYYLKDGELVCSQCDATSPLSKLHPAVEDTTANDENSGSMEGNGCTPIYLPARMHTGNIEIRLADLRAQRKYFEITPAK